MPFFFLCCLFFLIVALFLKDGFCQQQNNNNSSRDGGEWDAVAICVRGEFFATFPTTFDSFLWRMPKFSESEFQLIFLCILILPIWDVFTHEIWPIFATNIRHLRFNGAVHLDNLRRLISPTILTDLDQLNAINSGGLFPDGIDDDGPNASAGQALTKWLHTPRKDGQPMRLHCCQLNASTNFEWVNNFKEVFIRARTSVSYTIYIIILHKSTQIVPFELENEQTKEKMTLKKMPRYASEWLLKRCPIIVGETAAAVQWENDEISDANLNRLFFHLHGFPNCIGPLSPPANKSDENVCSSTAGPSSDQRNE